MVLELPPLAVLGVSLVVLVLSGWLFKQAAGSLSPRYLNLVSWVFYFELALLSFVGITLGAMGTQHYILNDASDASVQLAYWAVCYAMLAMPLSMVFLERVVLRGHPRRKLLTYFANPLSTLQSRYDSAQLLFWGLMTVAAAGATLYTYALIGEAPFVALLTASSDASFLSLRQEAKFGFEGNVYIRNFLSLLLAPLVSYIALAYLLMRVRFWRLAWFLFALLVAVMAVTYSGEKAPVILYALGLGFVYGYARGGFRWRHLLAMGMIGAVFVVGLYLLTTGGVHLALNTGPVGRLLFSQIAPLSLHFETFPKHLDFLRGASFPNWLAGLLGLEHLRSGRAVMVLYNPSGVAVGEAGVMNTLFMGEAWANFGWWGFFVAPWIVGLVVQAVYHLFLSLPKSPVFVAALAYLTLRMPVTGGFVDFLWNVGWLFLFLLLYGSVLFRPLLLEAARNERERRASYVR